MDLFGGREGQDGFRHQVADAAGFEGAGRLQGFELEVDVTSPLSARARIVT